jgi:hypothetical protein
LFLVESKEEGSVIYEMKGRNVKGKNIEENMKCQADRGLLLPISFLRGSRPVNW